MAIISYNLTDMNIVKRGKMNLFKHKIFINNKVLQNFDFEVAINNNKTRKGNEDAERIYLKKSFDRIDDNFYLLWIVRDTPVVDERDELVQDKSKRIEYDVERLIKLDINLVNNYFVVFDKKNSFIYTTNSTSNPASVNKSLIKYFLDAETVDVSSEVDYEETLANANTQTLTIKYHDNNQSSLFLDKKMASELLKKPSEYFGAKYIVQQKFKIDDKLFKRIGAAAKLDRLSNDENCAIYVEAIDEDGNEFNIDNKVIKKATKITEDKITKGSDMHEQILEFVSKLMEKV